MNAQAKTQLEHLPTAALIPYARNARTHSEQQVSQIANSITEFGFTNPILIDADNGIIAGHGRVMAASKLGLKTVPCLRLSHLTEAQKRAYILVDNQLALNAGWDEELLSLELLDLKDMDFNLDLIGFNADDLLAYLEPPEQQQQGLTDEDEVPEPPAQPISKQGDIWQLGSHRIMCGDSTHAADVEKLLGGGQPHIMVTDPPYGVEYDPDWRNQSVKNGATIGGGRALGKVMNDDRADWREAWALFKGDVAYVWHASLKTNLVIDSLQACGFEPRALIVWGKNEFAISRGHYHHKHESCWYVVKKGATGHWNGDRSQTTLWSISKNLKSETGHSTQKPIECMRKPIENNSSPGDSIYEPFSGSGTTIIACEQTGRNCYAMELNPAYVDMAVTRWENYTGQKAMLFTDQENQ
jgi:DNA modification methylase